MEKDNTTPPPLFFFFFVPIYFFSLFHFPPFCCNVEGGFGDAFFVVVEGYDGLEDCKCPSVLVVSQMLTLRR